MELLREAPEEYWMKRGMRMVRQLKSDMASVPAYKKFLRANGVSGLSSAKLEDLPLPEKKNYLRVYNYDDLFFKEKKMKDGGWVISTTSGSTGKPYYFPRLGLQDKYYQTMAEMYLLENFQIDKKKTLYLNGFPMGAWIGGVFTYEVIKNLARERDYPLSIISPGVRKQEIVDIVQDLGEKFDQVIIGSYGPFLKDILDDGKLQGVNWKKYNIGFIFAAEPFTEGFRDYVCKMADANPLTHALNQYGTVDQGTHAYETPASVLVRRLAMKDRKLFVDLFGDTIKVPTLAQYIPEFHYFEDLDGDLVCSSYSGIPLLRYDLRDRGGVKKFSQVKSILAKHGYDLNKLAREEGIKKSLWRLPFVYVYERSDFSVSLYAFQVYPEVVRRALIKPKAQKFATGKFMMTVKFDNRQNQYLEINVELKEGVKTSRQAGKIIQEVVTKQLLRESSEYRETHSQKGKRIEPRIIFWPHDDAQLFRSGAKQKWVKKSV